jgi:CheY-like chemotaxis protein
MLYLPATEETGIPSATTELAEPEPVGTETILIAEDDATVRGMVGRILRQAGYTLLEAADGQAALQAADQFPGLIHLLLTDLLMPGMNGVELSLALPLRRPQMRSLFMSGYSDESLLAKAALASSVPVLRKPFTAAVLLRTLRQVLAEKPSSTR